MRAAVATGINETEPLSMLELRDDWPDPIAPDGHTLARVATTSINMHDVWSMRGAGMRADPLIDPMYPFDEIHAAFERVQPDLNGKVIGRMGAA